MTGPIPCTRLAPPCSPPTSASKASPRPTGRGSSRSSDLAAWASEQRDPGRPRGGVVAVHAGDRLLKLVHTEVGRLRRDDAQRAFPCSAEALARANHASWSAVIEAGTLESIMDRFAERARRGDDVAAQAISILQIAREEALAGRIEIWPGRLRGVPIPAPAMVRGSLDSACGLDGRTMVIGLFEEGELWTSIALLAVGPGGFNLVLGPDEVPLRHGPPRRRPRRRDYRHLSRAVEDRASPLALGCYAEVATIRKLEVDPSPGAWARAAALRDVILSPLPAPLAIPLGVDARLGRLERVALGGRAARPGGCGSSRPALAALRDVTNSRRSRRRGGPWSVAFPPARAARVGSSAGTPDSRPDRRP